MCYAKFMKKAFTLAEVLITLGIIGVVAALVMPSLVTSYKEKATVVKLKKFHSVISQAYQRAVDENGTPDNWNLGAAMYDVQGAQNILNNLGAYLQFQKKCGVNTGCFPNVTYISLDGTNYNNFNVAGFMAKAVLADGTIFLTYVSNPDCSGITGQSPELTSRCAYLDVDINGFKPPNQLGRDTFLFMVTKTGIIPVGMPLETSYPFSTQCNRNSKGNLNGAGCTAWVVYNENMDYLHCDGLSWNGKTKCK